MHRTSSAPTWRVGSVGFGYADWRAVFYPPSVKPTDYLGFYSRHFDTVEIDSTFHAAPPRERFERWADVVPKAFRFAIKTPRAITHDGAISDVVEPMRAFLRDASAGLGEKLAVVLIQYPPALPGRVWPQVKRFLDALPDDGAFRYAIEFREPSWFRDEVYEGLAKRKIALVSAEYDRKPLEPILTTDFAYVRLIGRHGHYPKLDHERVDKTEQLIWWRDQLLAAETRTPTPRHPKTVWCMFNNDYAGFSIATADRFRGLLGQKVATQQERLGVLF